MKPVYSFTMIRKRIADHNHNAIDTPDKVASLCQDLEQYDREHLVALYMDSRMHLIGRETLHVGTTDSCMISPRDVFRGCLLAGALRVALVHNHPSGNPEPSSDDIQVAEQFEKLGEMLNLEMVDFLTIGQDGKYWSYSAGYGRVRYHKPTTQKPLDNYLHAA